MGSVVIDSPVHTPAHEWAKDTADALQPSPSIHNNGRVFQADSVVSTPGVEVPGAYPRDAVKELANDSPYKLQETVGQGIESAKQYLPAQETVNTHLQTAKSYIPSQQDVQNVLGTAAETAKQYLPERVVDAVGSVMPQGLVSSNGTTPPVDDIDPTSTAKPHFQPQDSDPSVYSNPQINEDGMSEDIASSSTPMSNATGALGGVSKTLGAAVGGVATTLDPTTDAKLSKPAEPRISMSNIQEPYGVVAQEPRVSTSNIQEPYGDVAQEKPHVVEQDSGIQKTNAALANLQAGPTNATEASETSAPAPPPKPDNEADLVGRQTAEPVTHINAQPTQDHIQSDSGLNAPPSATKNNVGGNLNATTLHHERRESLGSEASDESGSGKEDHSAKKGRGSRFMAKVKEKLHHKSS